MVAKRISLNEREDANHKIGRGMRVFTDDVKQPSPKRQQGPTRQVFVSLSLDLIKRIKAINGRRLAQLDDFQRQWVLQEAIERYIDYIEQEGDPLLEE